MSEKKSLKAYLENKGFKKKDSESSYDFYKRANGNKKIEISTKSKTQNRLDELKGKKTASKTRKNRPKVSVVLGIRG